MDKTPDAVQEARGALDAAVVPVEVLLRRGREEREEARGVGPVATDEVVGVHHVALGLRHLGPVLDDHALREEGEKGLVHLQHPEIAQRLGVEARVEEVEHRVLDAADVLVHRHPVGGGGRLEHAAVVGRRAVAEEVPGRLHERVHGVGVPPRLAPALGTGGVDEARHLRERRAALPADLHVARQHHRQVLLALRHHAVPLAVEHRDRGPPVALPADPPVAEAEVDLGLPEPPGHQPVDRLALGLLDGEPVEEAGVDLHAVAGVGLILLPALRSLHGGDDRQLVCLREVPVALVLARHRHDRPGAVAHQHVVGEEERDLRGAEWVHRAGLEPEAALGPVGGEPLDLGLARDLGAEGVDPTALLLVGGEAVHQRVLGGEHRVGHAEGGVGARGEDRDLEIRPARHRQRELGALAAADPVALHGEHPLRPAGQPVAPVEQLLGVVGDLEEPAVDLADRHLGIAAPAAARLDLLVGEHGLAGRAPVHARPPPVGEAALEHPDEDELLPLVVGGIAGGHLAVPVVGDAHALQLRAHVVDVLVGPHRRMHPVVDRRVLGGQAERVPAHRVQHVEAPHPLVAGQQIADRVDPHVAHVDAAGRVREHLEAVVLGPAGLLGHLELLAVRPGLLPPGLDLGEGVAVRTVVEGHIGADFYTLRRGAQETAPGGLERPPGVGTGFTSSSG